MDRDTPKPRPTPEPRPDNNLSNLVEMGGKKKDYNTGKIHNKDVTFPLAEERTLFGERIVSNPDILVGKPTIKGTRLSVEAVLGHLAGNPDFNDLREAYPGLSNDDVKECLGYAHALVTGELKQLRRHRRRGVPFFTES